MARKYFGSFAHDYHRAFEGRGKDPLHATINRLFRRRTFQRRTEIVAGLLEEHGVRGKTVLDLGCGTGEVSLVAARLGARVTGIDLVDDMVAIARAEVEHAELPEPIDFRVGEILDSDVPQADVTLLICVVEYYRDLDALLAKAAAATRELLIVVDTRGPLWRRLLRYCLARLKRFHLYYHPPQLVDRACASKASPPIRRSPAIPSPFMPFRRTMPLGQ